LLDKPGRYPGQLVGRSPYLQSVHLMAENINIGDIAPVTICAASQNSLSGTLAR
jgi:tRNA-2-methylthio-N6-dimethylallyladenosine synthase